jgi:hypothetical protein
MNARLNFRDSVSTVSYLKIFAFRMPLKPRPLREDQYDIIGFVNAWQEFARVKLLLEDLSALNCNPPTKIFYLYRFSMDSLC